MKEEVELCSLDYVITHTIRSEVTHRYEIVLKRPLTLSEVAEMHNAIKKTIQEISDKL